MDLMKRAVGYIRTMFGNMTVAQRVVIVALLVMVLGAIVWGSTSITSNGFTRIAGTDTSREERDQILKKLQEKNIRYELRNEEIFVPKENADQTVIELHGEGIFSDTTLWKFLDESNITASKWQQERRYQVAIQRKLERMIMSIKSIQRASVQLTPGDQAQALGFRGNEPTASVTVELRSGKDLSRANVAAVARLVANAMTGLKPHNVLIMDTSGRPYRLPQVNGDWDMAETRLDMEKQYGEHYENKIRSLYPEALAAVFVELSSEAVKKTEERFGKPVDVEKEVIDETDKSKTRASTAGLKGAEAPYMPGSDAGIEMDKSASENRRRSAVPKEFIETMIREGKVAGKSVSVVFPVPVAENQNVDDVIKQEQAKIPSYQQSIMSVVGLKEATAVAITFMPTRKPVGPSLPSLRESLSDGWDRWGGTLILGALILIALIIVYRLLRAALPKTAVEDIELLRQKLADDTLIPSPPEVVMAEEEFSRVKQSVREMVAKNPRNVASIMKQWMAGK